MSDLFAIAYDDLGSALQVRQKLFDLQKERLIDLEDALVVERRQDGSIKLHQVASPTTGGAVGGALWGGLIGMLFLAPFLGALVGGATGAAVGSLITALQTLPSIVWVPFAIILFGATTQAILFVVVMTAAPAIANGLIAGADFLPPLLLRAGKTMGLRRVSLYRHVIMPATLPAFVSGLKQGWAFGWHGLIAAEIVVIILGQPSLGVLLSNDQDQADMAGAIAIILVILVIGILVDVLFNLVNGRIRNRWGVADNSTSA